MKRKTRDNLFNLALFCFVIFVNILSSVEKQDRQLERQQQRQAQQAFDDALNQQINLAMTELWVDQQPNLKDQSLQLVEMGQTLNSRQIDELVSPNDGKSQVVLYGHASVGDLAMSAQGIGGTHSLVTAFLEGYAPFDVDNVMLPLYVLAQRKFYLLDSMQYPGRPEVWQTSREAFRITRGDCEDHAIILADWLIEMGEDARVVLGTYQGGGHAWVVLLRNGKEYLLEATDKSVSKNRAYPLAALQNGYHPRYMFNQTDFWVNAGSDRTRSYSGAFWEKRSIYSRGSAAQSGI